MKKTLFLLLILTASTVGCRRIAESRNSEMLKQLNAENGNARISAAEALAATGNQAAYPALVWALRDARNEPERWRLARALWDLGPRQLAAEEILSEARCCEGKHRYGLLEIIDAPQGHEVMTDDERLDYLLEHKAPRHAAGANAFFVSLTPREEDEHFLLEKDDRSFIEKYRSEVTERLLAQLDGQGPPPAATAFLLGHLKEKKALEGLRRWFIEVEEFYCWESSTTDELRYDQFPLHHAYEQAIGSISAGELNEAIQLDEREIERLTKRYSQRSASALYVLFRLVPDVAREEVCQQFRTCPQGERFKPAILLQNHFLHNELLTKDAYEMLSEPSEYGKDCWLYHCGRDGFGNPSALKITFDARKVSKSEIILLKGNSQDQESP